MLKLSPIHYLRWLLFPYISLIKRIIYWSAFDSQNYDPLVITRRATVLSSSILKKYNEIEKRAGVSLWVINLPNSFIHLSLPCFHFSTSRSVAMVCFIDSRSKVSCRNELVEVVGPE